MSASDWIALAQLALSLTVAVVGGTLGILGYFKLIRSADENAKERRREIEQNAKERQQAILEVGTKTATEIEKVSVRIARRTLYNTFALSGLCIWMFSLYARTLWKLSLVEKKLQALERKRSS